MRKISAALIAVLMAGATLVSMATPAQAVDRRPCTTLAEFRSVHANMTFAQVKTVLDGNGVLLTRIDDGYWGGEWIEDGYWESTWYDDGLGGFYLDEWVDMSYWQDEWVSSIDVVRSYPKCRTFDRGGRIGINFDNYSSPYSGMRVFTKVRYNPWQLVDLVSIFARTGEGLDKSTPQAPAKPPKPEPKPLTPDPHPNSGPHNG